MTSVCLPYWPVFLYGFRYLTKVASAWAERAVKRESARLIIGLCAYPDMPGVGYASRRCQVGSFQVFAQLKCFTVTKTMSLCHVHKKVETVSVRSA